ncbi:MAG: EI24 domain-containing protein [Rhodovibrionaceae bacterium]
MLGYLIRGFRQLSDPATRSTFWLSLLISIATFLALWIGAAFGAVWLGELLSAWLAGIGASQFWIDAAEILAGLGAIGAILFASFILFPAVIVMVLSFLLDDVCRQVEARHYPELPPAREQPLFEAILDGLRLALATIGLNILFLPLIIALSFVPPLNLFVFYGLNGYLLGREYFELVAVRRLSAVESRRLRKVYRGRILLAGVVIAILLTLPVINLVMPLVATALMVHVFEELRRRSGKRLENEV